MRDIIDSYLQRVGWPFEWSSPAEAFVAHYPEAGEPLDVRIRIGDFFLYFAVPRVAKAPRTGKLPVLEAAMSIQWDTCLPKFEWDRRDGELRATWYLPVREGPPTFEQFEQTLTTFARAVCDAKLSLAEAAARAGRTGSGDAADRIHEAANPANLGRDLVALASSHEILPMYVRENLVEALVAALDGPTQQVLLVGESGTGKNAMVHALATWIAAGDPRIDKSSLRDRHIYECVPEAFQASVFYAHELENKIQAVAENCMDEEAILFIDQTQRAVTSGRVEDQADRTIANLLLPFIARNELTIIGATDPRGLKTMLRENARFAQSFHIVDVPEPSMDETLLMVQDRMARFVSGHVAKRSFRFAPGVAHRVVELSGRFMRTQRYPGKALELLNAVVSYQSEREGDAPITSEDVEGAIACVSTLRADIVSSDAPVRREDVEAALTRDVVGQEGAVRAVADVVVAYKAEMSPPERPIGTMFFAGPTGVGKTRLARSLAEYLFGSEEALLRYDMSEFAGPEGYAKLCGRTGLRGEPGRLVQDVSAKPFSVILFDEIEKANSSVFDVLLQVLGEGRMTDDTGRTASFLNSIIIMTSNVGGHLYGRTPLGFAQTATRQVSGDDLREELERVFRPEFINRISHLICFRPLTREAVLEIARREVAFLSRRGGLARRGITVEPTSELLSHLTKLGYDAKYGARAMQRAVEELITIHIAQLLAAGPALSQVRLLVDWTEATGVTVASHPVEGQAGRQ